MSVSVSHFHTVELGREGIRLADVNERNGEITLWPQGVGVGISITFSGADWHRIQNEVRLAHMRADRRRG